MYDMFDSHKVRLEVEMARTPWDAIEQATQAGE